MSRRRVTEPKPQATDPAKRIRCAIYTRKSSEEGAGPGVQLARRPAGKRRGVHRQSANRSLGLPPRPL